jgi:hypothetical protein
MTKVECNNCEWTGGVDELDECADLLQRLEPGDIFPMGDCPKCGAFCHPVRPTRTRLCVVLEGGLVQAVVTNDRERLADVDVLVVDYDSVGQ